LLFYIDAHDRKRAQIEQYMRVDAPWQAAGLNPEERAGGTNVWSKS
jgi:hypothetical protein